MTPLVYIPIILGVVSIIFILAFLLMKDKKEAFGFERNMKDSVIIRRLLVYGKKYYKNYILILLLMAFTIVSDIVLPLITGDITSILQTKGGFEYTDVLEKVIIYISLLLSSLVCTYFQAITLQVTGQKILTELRTDLYKHIESLSANQLNHIPVGTLVTRISNDTHAISMMFSSFLTSFIKDIFLVIGFVVAMLLVNVKLAILVISFVPLILLFTYIFRKFVRKAFRLVKTRNTDMNIFLSENLAGIKVTQIFNQETRKLNEFKEKNEALCKAKYRRIGVFSVFRPTIYLLYISCLILLFYLAGNDALNEVEFLGQVITCKTIVIFYSYIGSFFTPVQNLAESFNQLQSAFASAEKIFTILDMQPELVDEPDAIELDEVKGDIEFKDVWFAYKDEHWILKGINLKINANETVALVGSTGAGKTTILSLLVRNYDIQKGEILLDGINIKHIKIASLRKHFGQMLQDVFIFSGTIKSNIVLDEPSITDDDVKKACDYVNASHFIDRLPNGINEEVRERGNNFSAGQRQLISFARTIVHKPEIMILDEATANIDTETEVLIQDSLEKMMNIGTMIIVAHRLSTVQHANKIIVLSRGVILEEGTHQELLKKKGKYYSLYQLQYNKELLKNN